MILVCGSTLEALIHPQEGDAAGEGKPKKIRFAGCDLQISGNLWSRFRMRNMKRASFHKICKKCWLIKNDSITKNMRRKIINWSNNSSWFLSSPLNANECWFSALLRPILNCFCWRLEQKMSTQISFLHNILIPLKILGTPWSTIYYLFHTIPTCVMAKTGRKKISGYIYLVGDGVEGAKLSNSFEFTHGLTTTTASKFLGTPLP